MGATAKQKGWETTDLTSRQPLHGFYPLNGKSIGEGDVVRLKAWILEAHVSDCAAGEEVNCGTPGFVNNDLHIPLVDPSAGGQKQGECTSVTSEISPHFRPSSWADLDLKTPVKNVVRVTGPLFYDNAHKPCATLTSTSAPTGDPARSTLWEIHPVYQLEVCASSDASQCDVNSDDKTVWIAYDQWISDPSNQQATAATGKQARDESSCARPTPPKPGPCLRSVLQVRRQPRPIGRRNQLTDRRRMDSANTSQGPAGSLNALTRDMFVTESTKPFSDRCFALLGHRLYSVSDLEVRARNGRSDRGDGIHVGQANYTHRRRQATNHLAG